MTKYLVTGGAGFIGSHIATALSARGEEVRVLDNLSTGRRENLSEAGGRIELVEADLLDRDALAAAMRGVEVVFHQAALASVPHSVEAPDESHAACATGTLNVLDIARRSGVRRVVYAASSSAYGDEPNASKRETDLLSPLSPYAAGKLAGELYCQAFARSYGLETVALRYFNVFGPRQDPESPYSAVIPIFVTLMLKGQSPTVFGDGSQSRDFVYVDNVVAANLAASQAEGVSGRVFNVATGNQTTLLELISRLNEALGTAIQPEFAPPRAGDVRESLADITAARASLGYDPLIDLAEGLRRSIEYYKSIVPTESCPER